MCLGSEIGKFHSLVLVATPEPNEPPYSWRNLSPSGLAVKEIPLFLIRRVLDGRGFYSCQNTTLWFERNSTRWLQTRDNLNSCIHLRCEPFLFFFSSSCRFRTCCKYAKKKRACSSSGKTAISPHNCFDESCATSSPCIRSVSFFWTTCGKV